MSTAGGCSASSATTEASGRGESAGRSGTVLEPLERWLSGRKRLPAKELQEATSVEGSNPSLSVAPDR
jgi:hypothetical protein